MVMITHNRQEIRRAKAGGRARAAAKISGTLPALQLEFASRSYVYVYVYNQLAREHERDF